MGYWRKNILRHQLQAALLYWLWIPAAVIGGGLLLDALGGWERWPRQPLLTMAALLAVAGGCWLVLRATRDFERFGNGTPAPQAPPNRLVSEGSYAWCRNPMFLGYDLAAFGVLLWLRSWGALLVAFPVFLILQVRFLKQREEKLLLRRFGDAYRTYRRQVPLLLPRLRPKDRT
jgi:protein-S-isoprenylcysteine O-methyltransferase Ste14